MTPEKYKADFKVQVRFNNISSKIRAGNAAESNFQRTLNWPRKGTKGTINRSSDRYLSNFVFDFSFCAF
jgi:hypothetical protein